MFFTNHLAGMMHRYLAYDKTFNNKSASSNIYSNKVTKALLIADEQIGNIYKFAKNNSYEIMIASSIGQDLIKEKNFVNAIFIEDFEKMKAKLSLDMNIMRCNAMYPDLVLKFNNKNDKNFAINQIESIHDEYGNSIIKSQYLNSGKLTVNFNIKDVVDTDYVFLKEQRVQARELGLSTFKRGKATAYHIKEGIILSSIGIKNTSLFPSNISLKNVKEKLMKYMLDK